jgi:hypothetical protein
VDARHVPPELKSTSWDQLYRPCAHVSVPLAVGPAIGVEGFRIGVLHRTLGRQLIYPRSVRACLRARNEATTGAKGIGQTEGTATSCVRQSQLTPLNSFGLALESMVAFNVGEVYPITVPYELPRVSDIQDLVSPYSFWVSELLRCPLPLTSIGLPAFAVFCLFVSQSCGFWYVRRLR